jgi:hypothetical protein
VLKHSRHKLNLLTGEWDSVHTQCVVCVGVCVCACVTGVGGVAHSGQLLQAVAAASCGTSVPVYSYFKHRLPGSGLFTNRLSNVAGLFRQRAHNPIEFFRQHTLTSEPRQVSEAKREVQHIFLFFINLRESAAKGGGEDPVVELCQCA